MVWCKTDFQRSRRRRERNLIPIRSPKNMIFIVHYDEMRSLWVSKILTCQFWKYCVADLKYSISIRGGNQQSAAELQREKFGQISGGGRRGMKNI